MSNPPNVEPIGPQARIQTELLRSESQRREFWVLIVFAGLVLLLGILCFFFPHQFWYNDGLHVRLSPEGLFVIMVALVLASLVYFRRDLVVRGGGLANAGQDAPAEAERAPGMIDGVTNVFSRNFLHDLLTTEISRAERSSRSLALIMSHVENFSQVKGRYGELMADYVLSQIATILKSCVRCSDYVARYGEEEFLVVLPETDATEGEVVRQRMYRKVAEFDQSKRAGDAPVSVRLGLYIHATGNTADKDIAETDACLYAEKQVPPRAPIANSTPPPPQA